MKVSVPQRHFRFRPPKAGYIAHLIHPHSLAIGSNCFPAAQESIARLLATNSYTCEYRDILQALAAKTVLWQVPTGTVPLTAARLTLDDKVWEQPIPTSGEDQSSEHATMSYRDNAMDFSEPVREGIISLALFGAKYTGDRVPSDEERFNPGSWIKLASERDVSTGFTGKNVLADYDLVRCDSMGNELKTIVPPSALPARNEKQDVIEISDEDEPRVTVTTTKRRRSSGSAKGPVAKKAKVTGEGMKVEPMTAIVQGKTAVKGTTRKAPVKKKSISK